VEKIVTVYLNVNTNELVCYDKKTKTMEAEDTSFQVEPWAFMLFTEPFLVKIGVL
jgi:hypothetical protein